MTVDNYWIWFHKKKKCKNHKNKCKINKPNKYLWLSVLLDRLMGWFPLLGRFGPMIAFSKAQTIFSKLLALCLFGMALMGVVRRQDGRFRFDANIRKR